MVHVVWTESCDATFRMKCEGSATAKAGMHRLHELYKVCKAALTGNH